MENIKLQNVDPVTFLKGFNKLVDYYDTKAKAQSQPKLRGLNQLSLQPLTKFPIRKHFDKIEGIYTSTIEKRLEENDRAKQKFNIQDEEFMKKHHQFMSKTLTRMIDDNKSHIGIIQKSKTFYLLKEARKKNVEGQVRIASKDLRDLASADASRTQKTQRDLVPTRPEVYQTDDKVLNTDSFKNPKPIIVRNKRQASPSQGIKLSSAEQIDKILAEKRKRRTIEMQQTVTNSNATSRREINQGKSDSPINTLVRRSQSLLGSEFTSLFQSRNGTTQHGELNEQDLFDPERYVKGRFEDPTVQLRYDYQRGQKEMTDKFKKRLAYHYINDEKLI